MERSADRRRWWALCLLCCAVLMVVLDTTIVTVALPSIAADLHLSPTGLTWLVNAYTISFGGLLVSLGRLGDRHGKRSVLLFGVGFFALASLACGLAPSYAMLVVIRAIQGIGGAAIIAVTLSLIADLFPDPVARAKAMGIYGFVCATAGAAGQALGGVLTAAVGWRWIFLINVPVGLALIALSGRVLPREVLPKVVARADVAGAVVLVLASALLVHGVLVLGSEGVTSVQAQGALALAMALLLFFVRMQWQRPDALVPLHLLKIRTFMAANLLAAVWAGAISAWAMICALYLQQVLSYDPLQVGLAFIPATFATAAFSLGASAKVVTLFGTRWPLVGGLLLIAAGLVFFACAPADAIYTLHVLPGMLLLGLGGGLASSPVLLAAMQDVHSTDSGAASGIINTSFMVGGAIGLATLASTAAARTETLRAAGSGEIEALIGGYHFSFALGALLVIAAGVLAALLVRSRERGVGDPCVHPTRSEMNVAEPK